MTAANVISGLLFDDGQRFETTDGTDIDALIADHRGKPLPASGTVTRVTFPDGSALIVSSDAWDMPLSDDERCACFETSAHHDVGCPLCEQPA